jgi:hypothetical protein
VLKRRPTSRGPTNDQQVLKTALRVNDLLMRAALGSASSFVRAYVPSNQFLGFILYYQYFAAGPDLAEGEVS